MTHPKKNRQDHCTIPSSIAFVLMVLIFARPGLSASGALDTSLLPAPVFEPEPGYVDLYWKAWELAYDHIATDDGAIQSPFMDEGRREGYISLWESAFIAQFTKYAPDIFPGIESLNEYYAQIHDNATSSQTIEHKNNPPILAWAEWEHFLMTGDKARVQWLLEEKEYLQKHFTWFHDSQVRQWDQWGKGYRWTHEASGMVNTPRGRYPSGTHDVCEGGGHSWTCTEPWIKYLSGNDFSWLDAVAQQCLSAQCIHLLAQAIGNETLAAEWKSTWETYRTGINEYYYHKELGKFWDVIPRTLTSPQVARTPASFWTLVSEAASTEFAEKTVSDMVTNPGFFGDAAPFPSLVLGDLDSDMNGRGWRGGVYVPIAYMGIRGLEKYGYTDDAARLARNMVEHMYRTWVDFEPHTIWEAYSPTERKPATDTGGVDFVHADYVGWSGIGPISLFIEYVLGFHTIDAAGKRVEWDLHWPEKHGIKRLSFGSVQTDIIYENGTVTATTNEDYTLAINGEEHEVSAGEPVTITVQAPAAPEPVPPLIRYPLGEGIRVEAEGVVEYPANTGNTFYGNLCGIPWRFLCECSQGWKIWVDSETELPPLPKGNALLFRIAYGGSPTDLVKWIISVNGEVHSRHEGYGNEWQYFLLTDVPLTKETNTVSLRHPSVNFFSMDFVEVLTLDPSADIKERRQGKRSVVPAKNMLRVTAGELVLSLSRSGMTGVDIIDLSGRHVACLIKRNMTAGTHRLSLPQDRCLPGAVYVVRLTTDGANHAEAVLTFVKE